MPRKKATEALPPEEQNFVRFLVSGMNLKVRELPHPRLHLLQRHVRFLIFDQLRDDFSR